MCETRIEIETGIEMKSTNHEDEGEMDFETERGRMRDGSED